MTIYYLELLNKSRINYFLTHKKAFSNQNTLQRFLSFIHINSKHKCVTLKPQIMDTF